MLKFRKSPLLALFQTTMKKHQKQRWPHCLIQQHGGRTTMLLNFPRRLSILLLQTSKTDNNALDIDAIYNLKLRKT
jgi:hypothetical protein